LFSTFAMIKRTLILGWTLHWQFSSVKGEATSTKTWKTHIILESSRELATRLT
jgi:hypothetical protein